MKIRLIIIFTSLLICSFGQTDGYEKTKALYDKGKPQEAIDLGTIELKKLKTSDVTYKKIVRLRVDCFMELGNFVLAISDWKTLIALDSKDKTFYEGIAYAYWANSDLTNCLSNIDKAYSIAPKDAGILSNMSYYYGEAGKYNESINYATTGLKQSNVDNNTKASLLNNRGFAYLQLKQPNKAIEDINKSISLNPDNSFAYCYRALTNIELKKMDTVCADLEKSKSLGGIQLTKDLIPKYCKK
jgi:tetratricopeptide (TPR) repeat protein